MTIAWQQKDAISKFQAKFYATDVWKALGACTLCADIAEEGAQATMVMLPTQMFSNCMKTLNSVLRRCADFSSHKECRWNSTGCRHAGQDCHFVRR